MDYQEAIEALSNHERYVGVKYVNGVEEAYVTPYFEKALDTAISAMQELQEYRRLGTLEEVMDMVEKQEEERPQKVLGIFGGEEYECRECGNTVEYMDDYCKWCGKAQDWSEKE